MVRAQGAIELSCGSTARTCHGQGATEYLVLLAVVLIVALVSVALLGFFPGMASDAQIAQSKAYYASLQPISISIEDARTYSLIAPDATTYPYIRLKNNGAYPIRITKALGPGGSWADSFYTELYGLPWSPAQFAPYYYISPGEETYFGHRTWNGDFPSRLLHFSSGTSTGGAYLGVGNANALCQNSRTAPGTLNVPTFGFEYIEYIDGQQITKREMGQKPLIFKCRETY